jgi:hypothetical protein
MFIIGIKYLWTVLECLFILLIVASVFNRITARNDVVMFSLFRILYATIRLNDAKVPREDDYFGLQFISIFTFAIVILTCLFQFLTHF